MEGEFGGLGRFFGLRFGVVGVLVVYCVYWREVVGWRLLGLGDSGGVMFFVVCLAIVFVFRVLVIVI